MSFYDAIRVGASGAADFEIERSLRFNDDDSAYLNRTPSSAGNRKKWTFSVWIKRANLSGQAGEQRILGGNSNASHIFISTDDKFRWDLANEQSSSASATLRTNAAFRDPSAWYHLVCALDTDNSTADNRMRMYVNGTEITSFAARSNPSSGYATNAINNNTLHTLGKRTSGQGSAGMEFDGYMAEINFIDGQQYDPSYFGETDADTGQWVPKDTSGLTFGTNGYRLQFADNSGTTATTLGKDTSGNGNNFTPNNFSVAAGVGNDSLEDTPTNNFCTLKPLVAYTTNYATFSNGNLDFNLAAGSTQQALGSFLIPKTGKWYVEYVFSSGGGIASVSVRNPVTLNTVSLNGIAILEFSSGTTQMRADNSYLESATQTYGDGDIVGIKIDQDAGTVQFTVDGSNASTAINLSQASDTSDLVFAVSRSQGGNPAVAGSVNFGQRPFSYLPTGYKSLCSANLPDPTILLPNEEFDTKLWTGNGGTQTITGLNFSPDFVWIKIRTQAYNHVLWDTLRGIYLRLQANKTNADGTNTDGLTAFNSDGYTLGSMNNVNKSGDTFVGWNWNAGDTDSATYTVKVVSDSGNKYRFNDFGTSAVTLDLAEGGTYTFDGSDSSMSGHPFVIGTAANGSVYSTGVTYQLDGASVTYSAYTSGYSSATTRKLIITVPASAPQLYYWCSIHSGMGGAINTNTTLGSSNFDGSIQSVAKANATAGFSIVKYTGTGSTATIGHGLGVAPEFMFVKSRDSADHWALYHHKIGNTKVVYMDIINAPATSSAYWNNTSPTSSVFTVGSDNKTNKSGDNFVAYCYSGVSQYSKFGEYTGNGSSDGSFIYLGFKPAFFMFRQVTYSDNWFMYDNKRDTFNPTDKELNPSNAQTEASSHDIDFLSNGVKLRTNNSSWNYNGYKYIYLAFAELPFKNARAK